MAVVRSICSHSHAKLTHTLQEDASESVDRFQAVLELEVVQWRRHSKSVQHSASHASLRHSCRVNIMSMHVIPNLQIFDDIRRSTRADHIGPSVFMDTSGLTDMHITKLLTEPEVYVTNDERKAALTAVHVRCWRRGAEDHSELRRGRVSRNSLSWHLLFTAIYYSRPRGE